MPHFVTSAQGKAHVTSANAAHLTAGLLGNGCYVLPIGQRIACTMTDSNTLRVLFGVASVCGRQWEIEGDYEEVNIDNGVPGYNRTDLLVCRIETAPQETIELKVYKGEETTGTPVVPGHVEGDLNDGDTVCEMPICSVRVNGINPQAPVMLAEESIDIMALLQELRDYKSQAINGGKLVDKSVGAAKLADKSVTTTKLADKAVTLEKMGGIGDAIVQRGSSGSWAWEKYSSGMMHLHGSTGFTTTPNKEWGAIFYDGAVRGGTAYPVSFSATPSVTVSLEQTTGSIFATQLDAGTISSAPRVYVCSPTKQTASLAARLHVDAWGAYSVTGGHPIG
ncbi:hypothetical protein [Adlercreutzia sp.]|uniref:hypothetical protein n=1 Tax=Adlercreutzia sp. TaxID=1872387 RepID=UPI003AB5AD74